MTLCGLPCLSGGRAWGVRSIDGRDPAGACWSRGMVALTSLGQKADCHARVRVVSVSATLVSWWTVHIVDGCACRPTFLLVPSPFPLSPCLRLSFLRL